MIKLGKSLNGKDLGKGITQRKDGLYQARYTDSRGGRRTIYNSSLTEIKKELKHKNKSPCLKKSYTLREWFDVWITTFKLNCRRSTLGTYRRSIQVLLNKIGDYYLDDLNAMTLQVAFNELKSDSQRKNMRIILSDMFVKAIDAGYISSNPMLMVNTKKDHKPKQERRVLTEEEEKTFLKYAEKSKFYNLFIVALNTGMREGELMALRLKDIDFEENVIRVNGTLTYLPNCEIQEPKTASGFRTIPMTKKVQQAIKNQLEYNKKIRRNNPSDEYKDFIFINIHGKPLRPEGIRSAIESVLKKINKEEPFERLTAHCFRHTFATRAIERGMQPKVLQKILGHASLSMTMDLYCHVSDNSLHEAMRLFG